MVNVIIFYLPLGGKLMLIKTENQEIEITEGGFLFINNGKQESFTDWNDLASQKKNKLLTFTEDIQSKLGEMINT